MVYVSLCEATNSIISVQIPSQTQTAYLCEQIHLISVVNLTLETFVKYSATMTSVCVLIQYLESLPLTSDSVKMMKASPVHPVCLLMNAFYYAIIPFLFAVISNPSTTESKTKAQCLSTGQPL